MVRCVDSLQHTCMLNRSYKTERRSESVGTAHHVLVSSPSGRLIVAIAECLAARRMPHGLFVEVSLDSVVCHTGREITMQRISMIPASALMPAMQPTSVEAVLSRGSASDAPAASGSPGVPARGAGVVPTSCATSRRQPLRIAILRVASPWVVASVLVAGPMLGVAERDAGRPAEPARFRVAGGLPDGRGAPHRDQHQRHTHDDHTRRADPHRS